MILVSFLNRGEVGTQAEGVTGLGGSSEWLKLKSVWDKGSMAEQWSWSRLGRPWQSARMWWNFSGEGELPVCLQGIGSHTLPSREPFLPPLSRCRGCRHTHVKGSEVSDGGFSEMGMKGSSIRTC